MRILIIAVLLFAIHSAFAASMKNLKTATRTVKENSYPFLEFNELTQFPGSRHRDKFDLSSLVKDTADTVYTISDKEKNNFIYKVDWKNAELKPEIPFGVTDTLDIEAIDICGEEFYLSNEKNDKFYIVKNGEKTREFVLDYSAVGGLSKGFLSGNKGFEGMAIDCENQIMYLAKEREPRFLLNVDLKTRRVLKQWNIPETDAFDFSEAKYENGFLYLLERTGMLVTKVDPKTEKVIAKFSYQNMEKSPGYLYGPAIYTFAEALMLTPTEIWIGFDNNGLKVTKEAKKDLGIKNRDPLIMRFKRPANF